MNPRGVGGFNASFPNEVYTPLFSLGTYSIILLRLDTY